ncbi:MAG: hypothetical protein E6R05_06585 [Candidatus Moraniibacteriota bacterium]|nr:MAG: hypothetical protein E6R05_06585 [Candidatus Moranbacteria bacterium]
MKVRKEVTLAIIIGLFIAIIIAGGIYRAKTAIENFDPQSILNSNKEESNSPDINNDKKLFIELDTPDNLVTDSPSLKISGKTLPNTYIAITTEQNDYLIVPNNLGSFSQEVTLIKGANSINVTVFTSDGTKVESSLSAVYTTATL